MSALRHSLVLSALALAVSACVSSRGIAPTVSPMTVPTALGSTARLQSAALPGERWWQALGDPALDRLVDAALRDAPGITVAAMRLQRARIVIDAAEAAYGPGVTLNANPTQQRFSENHLTPKPLAGSVRTNNRLALDFAGEIDLWGKHKAAFDGAVAQEKVAAAELAATRLAISSAIVRAWGELDRITHQRSLVSKLLATRDTALDLQRLREKAGFEPGVERAQTEAAMAGLRSELRALEERALTQRHLLAALAGLNPADGETLPDPVLRELPPGLPQALPAELLARRPEVVAARWRVEATSKDAAVTRAGFYPNINISGFIGFQALGLDKWIEFGSRAYQVGPVISLPIFDAGRLRATYGMKTADVDAAVAQYNQSLVDGLRDIVDSLTALQGSDAQLTEQQTVRDKALEAATLLARREQRGLINHLPVLNADLQVLGAERNLTDLAARRFDARVQLVRAVGGDGAVALKELLPARADANTASKKDQS
ncbi:efflux transporter outer membrane subunit [Viridibacterium curvum]|uniref:Efflux transporter outer membrane subunit n=1 Tax=Viridibacterium curvum TaxID=1101404 RepID=A0ABP9QQX3_9RHOO